MAEQGSLKEALRKNRWPFLAILLLPVVGMAVAMLLITVRAPHNLGLIIVLILVMILQYVVTVYIIMLRFNRLVEPSKS